MEHPAVLDCAVIGVPDEKWGEAVKAIVELKSGVKVSDRNCASIAGPGWRKTLKAPKTVEIWDSLPRSALGKVLKREIRERYWQDQARRV